MIAGYCYFLFPFPWSAVGISLKSAMKARDGGVVFRSKSGGLRAFPTKRAFSFSLTHFGPLRAGPGRFLPFDLWRTGVSQRSDGWTWYVPEAMNSQRSCFPNSRPPPFSCSLVVSLCASYFSCCSPLYSSVKKVRCRGGFSLHFSITHRPAAAVRTAFSQCPTGNFAVIIQEVSPNK